MALFVNGLYIFQRIIVLGILCYLLYLLSFLYFIELVLLYYREMFEFFPIPRCMEVGATDLHMLCVISLCGNEPFCAKKFHNVTFFP